MSRARTAAGLLLAVVGLGLSACGPGDLDRGPASAPTHSERTPATSGPAATDGPAPAASSSPAPDGTALSGLEGLAVRGRAPMTGYDREQFGQAWSDAVGDWAWSRNGCDTRNDLLRRDLQQTTVETNGCVVVAGTLALEPYSGDTDRSYDKHDASLATDLDVDHVVSLGNAWATGAQQLDPQRRAELANDPDNLLLVDPSLNRRKGDGDAATWLPPDKAFRCSYAARQIRVKAAYDLWVTPPEKAALLRLLAPCPGEPIAQPDPEVGHEVETPSPSPSPTPTTDVPAGSSTSPGTSTYFANCTAVEAAGAAPIRRGDPGYSRQLDRDGDGVGCEQ